MKTSGWRRSEFEKILPPNVNPEKTVRGVIDLFAAGVLLSVVWFLIRYSEDYRALFIYDYVRKEQVLNVGATMVPFTEYIVCAGALFMLFAFIIVVWAITLYGSFSQGSHSLYLMHRLPEGRKVLRRYVLQGPAECLLLAGVACAVLLGGYYLVWRFVTPEVCLPV